MTKEERMQLIRGRVGGGRSGGVSKPQGVFKSGHPEECPNARKTGYVKVYRPRNYHAPFGILLGGEHRRMDWVSAKDEQPRAEVKCKRSKQVSALTKIAERWGELKRQPIGAGRGAQPRRTTPKCGL